MKETTWHSVTAAAHREFDRRKNIPLVIRTGGFRVHPQKILYKKTRQTDLQDISSPGNGTNSSGSAVSSKSSGDGFSYAIPNPASGKKQILMTEINLHPIHVI